MTINARQLAGSFCATVYEREQQPEFQDLLFFYCDGKIRFERACYGEAAGLVFEVWGSGFDNDNHIQWLSKPKYDSHLSALPDKLTAVIDAGNSLQFDNQRRRFIKVDTLSSDPDHGYNKWNIFFIKRRK